MDRRTDFKNIATLVLVVISVMFSIWTFTGKWFWLDQPYNSYILQAQAWKDGRLSLYENYSHLELAEFNGKYYVSFPPFPSFLMFPFVLLGFANCDGLIAVIFSILAVIYAYKIFKHFEIDNERAMLFSLLLTIGSNWLFTVQVAWVWFIAQNMAFSLCLMAIYYALKKKSGLSLALWACAVGCRPFQVMYLPVILYIVYDRELTFVENIKVKWKALIPSGLIAVSYMALNFARFGNPLEFGHNYLPEFIKAENGQFSVVYMAENIKNMFRMPEISFVDKWEYQAFNGTNIFLVSPIFIAFVLYTIYAFINKNPQLREIVLILMIVIVELLCITAHKTMGGSQFGNRYTNDVLPLVFLCIAYALPQKCKYVKLNVILLMIGVVINSIGSVIYYM